jgi:predicted nucleic acid-binding protein
VDTNVILDWLLNRSPWSVDARPLWLAHAQQLVIAYVSASAVTDLFYIARRARDIPTAFAFIDQLLAAFDIVPVNDTLLRAARALPGNDFEDNVQIACAQAAGLDLIVTRDPAGFAHAGLPAIAPFDISRYLP